MVPIRATLLGLLWLVPHALSAALPAGGVPEEEVVAIEKRFAVEQANLKTFSAEILQAVRLAGMPKPVESKGRLSYSREAGALRIEFARPEGEWLLILPEVVAIKKRNQAARVRPRSALDDAGPALLLGFFEDPDKAMRNYNCSMERDGETLKITHELKLGLDMAGPVPWKIVSTVTWPSLEVKKMEVTISDKSTLEFTFSNMTRNGPLAPGLFVIPPATGGQQRSKS